MCRGSAARVLYEAETLEQQTMHLHKCDHGFFFRGGGGGGGVVRLTAKPRYLLLLHRGNKKSNTVTALLYTMNCVNCDPEVNLLTSFLENSM